MGKYRRNKNKRKHKNRYTSYVPVNAPEAIQRPPGWVSPYNYKSNKPDKNKPIKPYRMPQRGDPKVESVMEIAEEIFGGTYWRVGEPIKET